MTRVHRRRHPKSVPTPRGFKTLSTAGFLQRHAVGCYVLFVCFAKLAEEAFPGKPGAQLPGAGAEFASPAGDSRGLQLRACGSVPSPSSVGRHPLRIPTWNQKPEGWWPTSVAHSRYETMSKRVTGPLGGANCTHK